MKLYPRRLTPLGLCLWLAASYAAAPAQRQMENLGRGVVAFNQGGGNVYVGWRMLGTDPSNIAFNLYRSTDGNPATKLNASPLTSTTDYVDAGVDLTKTNVYYVRPMTNGVEWAASLPFTVPAYDPVRQYLAIPLHQEPTPQTLPWGKVAPGDLDGDGEYDFVVNHSSDPGSDPWGLYHHPSTDTIKIDGYRRDGTFLWRIDLGWNIEVGDDFSPMLVYDVDGDGKAEIITKTSEGTTDGTGVTIGDVNGDGKTDYRDPAQDGRVLAGPEFFSIFSGETGKELARTNWIARGNVSDWGDTEGNRASRFLMGIAYLDGVRPSIAILRGVYVLAKVETWDFRGGKLTNVWSWSTGGNHAYEGQTDQSLRTGDVDGDGKDEILNGALVLNYNGTVRYSTGLGHSDFSAFTDVDPDRPGLEIFSVHETPHPTHGIEVHDASTGALLWGTATTNDTDFGVAADIDPRYRGYECWARSAVVTNGLYDAKGSLITTNRPIPFWAVWWDADVLRELTTNPSGGIQVDKWNHTNQTLAALLTTGPNGLRWAGMGDVMGDWREELFSFNSSEIRIYTTTIPATNRFYTLMHDPNYRLQQALQPMRNTYSPQPGFYLGTDMSPPPTPNIFTRSQTNLVWRGAAGSNQWDVGVSSNWFNGAGAAVFSQSNRVVFDNVGWSPVNLNGALRPGALNFYADKDYVFDGSGSLTGATTLVKWGTGRLSLNNTNRYTGGTSIAGGTLLVDGRLAGSAVVATGEGRVGGEGSIADGVIAQWGGTISPGDAGVAGTLNISNGLTLRSGNLGLDLADVTNAGNGINDLIRLQGGTLTLTGTNTVTVNALAGDLTNDAYTLISGGATTVGSTTNLLYPAIPPGARRIFSFDIATPGTLLMRVTGSPPATLFWRGNNDIVWDYNVTTNWLNNAVPDKFFTYDTAIFNDSAITGIVAVVGNVQPYAITVSNQSKAYVFNSTTNGLDGLGWISGAVTLTKLGGGVLVLRGSNIYSGGTVISNGTLTLSNTAAAGSGAINLSGGTLNLNATGSPAFYPNTLNVTGTSTLTTPGSGNNNQALSGAWLGDGTLYLNTGSAGTFSVQGNLSGFSGTVILTGSGTFRFFGSTGSSAATFDLGSGTAFMQTRDGGTVSLGALVGGSTTRLRGGSTTANPSTYVIGGNGASTIYAGMITNGTAGSNATVSVVKVGAGTLTLTGNTNRYEGLTTISNGTLQIGNGGATGTLGTNDVVNYGTLTFNRANGISYGGMISGSGGLTKLGAGILTLSGVSTYTGLTTIGAGTLALTNTGALASSANLDVASGATLDVSGRSGGSLTLSSGQTLKGNGSVKGNLTVGSGATVSPGGSVGVMTFSNNVILATGSTTVMELNKPPLTNDLIRVLGTLTYGGTLRVTNLVGALGVGDSFRLFNAGSYVGTFASLNLPVLEGGLIWDTNELGSNGTIEVIGPGNTNAPVLVAITDKTITEGRLLSFTNSANDTDGDGLTYSLEAGAPAGAVVNPTNGVFSWIPTETQGPGTNTITVRVTDDGLPSLSDTKSFMVTVLETNSAPVLSAIGDRVAGVGTTLWVTNVVIDPDIPVNGLTYSLEAGAPVGMTINATNGVLSWTPGLGEVDTTNAVTVRVTDDGVPVMSDTNRFVVRVELELLVIGGLVRSNGVVRVDWSAVSGHVYRLQYRVDLWGETNWTDAGGEVVAVSTNAWQTNVVGNTDWRFYRVFLVP